MKTAIFSLLFFFLTACAFPVYAQRPGKTMISGKILSTEKEVVDFATVYLKGTGYGGITNQEGIYHVSAPAGDYTLVVSAVGYKTVEKPVTLVRGQRVRQNVTITPETQQLDEVTVVSTGVSRVKRSAFNAVAVDTKELQNTTRNLSDALTKAPGMKLRESGGVGSDMQLMLDGFSGKHVKVFIDGVPQEGVGSSFALNNIPVNFADRIEVYKGVVPVGFGTDAIGGVINIVTNKKRRRWFLDASYSYGSFNTHKSNVHFGQTFKNGFTYEINAFQNYSDNDYRIDSPVEDFETGRIDRDKKVRVRRFNDTYHNEAVIGKVGVIDKKWADRLMFGFTYSNMYQDVQTGVRQDIVYGQKHRKGHSLMPSLEYHKRDLFTKGLDVSLTANYNYNLTQNIDTVPYQYNWYGEKQYTGSKGEQSYQDNESKNKNWNGTFKADYRLSRTQTFTLSHVLTVFERSNRSDVNSTSAVSDFTVPKKTRKNITGLSYRLMPAERWNFSAFGKYYNQHSSGLVSQNADGIGNYIDMSKHVSALGYGAAGTYWIIRDLQVKLSYEKAYRLPSNEELFGDEDLEAGKADLNPENSDNINLNLSYTHRLGKHELYVEGSLIYRDTKDYIVRTISSFGGKSYGSYYNHGRVKTKGFNVSARYSYSHWLSVGGTYSSMDTRDNEKYLEGGSLQESLKYKLRIPNQPYRYASLDASLYWHDLFAKGNRLSFTYDSYYQHEFPLNWETIGEASSKKRVPEQFSHNLGITYSIKNGRYNLSLECKNFTDEKLYDNYSLQKAGRAFYGKVRVYFGQ